MNYEINDLMDAPIDRDSTPNLLKGLISNDEFDPKIRKNFSFIFNKDLPLSFQDETSKRMKLLDFDIIKIDTLFDTPYDDYTFEMEGNFNKLKFILDTKLDRAKGFKDAKRINERIAQQSQFSEQKAIQENVQEKSSFLTNMFRRK
jgi:hypothetical protein